MRIPYVDIAAQHQPLREELLAAVAEVIDSGALILGPHVERFEQRFAELAGVQHAIGVNSGTDALVLSLRALGIGPGDEVITAPNAFVAAASAIRIVGADVVFADAGDDLNIDPERVAAAVTPRTRAVMPVHLTGRPCDMDALRAAVGPDVAIVEDAAQAVGARWKGRPVGSIGTLGAFSLHPLKNLNALGDGGVVTTDDDALADEIRLLRNLGLRTREDAVRWCSNSRLDSVQAAMLLVKLGRLDEVTARRQANARRYAEQLDGVPGLRHVPRDDADRESVYHTFVIQTAERDALRAHLEAEGIGTAIHYPVPIHLMTAGRELGYAEGSFPVAERQAREIVSLPVHQGLGEAEIDTVAEAVRAFCTRS